MTSRRVGGLSLLVTLACAAPAEAVRLDSEAALVSDYRWRGISLSDEDPSLQAEATISFDDGAWLWTAANSVGEAYGDTELGFGVGYDASFAGLDWSVSALRYIYPDGEALDYTELDASATRTLGALSLSAGLEYAPRQDNLDADDLYLWAGFGWQISRFNLHGQIGRDDGLVHADDAIDYSLGAGFTFQSLSADLSFVDSDAADSAWVLRLAQTFSAGAD